MDNAFVKNVDLVLEGGGVKGIGLVGAISELDKAGYRVQRVAGTSAGAIVGAFMAAGCDVQELTSRMEKINYRQLRDKTVLSHFGAPGMLASLLFENGIYKGDHLTDLVAQQLESCGVKTFGDLKLSGSSFDKLPPNERYRLTVVTADLSKGELVYLPRDYHKYGLDPEKQSVAVAIRASMALPFIFKPAQLKGNLLVDGSLLSNFPVDAFDRPINLQPNWPTFGIKLSSREDANLIPRQIKGPLGFISALFDTAINGHDQRHLNNPETLERTIFVDTSVVQVSDFDISDAEQQQLLVNGQNAAKKFLKHWDYAQFKRRFRSKTAE